MWFSFFDVVIDEVFIVIFGKVEFLFIKFNFEFYLIYLDDKVVLNDIVCVINVGCSFKVIFGVGSICKYLNCKVSISVVLICVVK